ncbi:hypothetical protein [Candidatus Aalborgicola defluviihabitans]|uniref:hypothetical protein n=1 Tax=Candidatus Aalborgicola defluviihabitans TaxID=3386187 RepID=UPI001D63DDDB|nr:helix-turn-helix domain-containing protein [Burkholderiales bacterium]
MHAVLTVKEFEQEFKVGHTVAHAEIKSGRLVTYKLGRRRYISAAAAFDWQKRLEAENNQQGNGPGIRIVSAATDKIIVRSTKVATDTQPGTFPKKRTRSSLKTGAPVDGKQTPPQQRPERICNDATDSRSGQEPEQRLHSMPLGLHPLLPKL